MSMKTFLFPTLLLSLLCLALAGRATPSTVPAPGATSLQLLAPQVLELDLTSSWAAGTVDVLTNYLAAITNAASYSLTVNGQAVNCVAVGYERRPCYAVENFWDLRVRESFYLITATPLSESSSVTVTVNLPGYWQTNLAAQFSPARLNPALHVSAAGYPAGLPKQALIGCLLGTLGEMPVTATNYTVLDTNGSAVYTGPLILRPDSGFAAANYEEVWSADLTPLTNNGVYQLQVPGMGLSAPFRVGDEFGALLTRTYELGLLNQRCGMAVGLPYTRFGHDICHDRPAAVPTTNMTAVAAILNYLNGTLSLPAGEVRMTNLATALYPYINAGPVDTTGGHHDAGDYSKYTPDCATLANTLLFAVDTFPGVGTLDNLGVPESGDGIPDLLQEAKWEIDYIAKLQDADGGFYSIVYPENREYEVNCLPQNGDNQVVYPKTTTATAAAVAILAQAASSPAMKQYYPAATAQYLTQALNGYAFLTNAYATYGHAGASQHMGQSYYGQEDNLAWAYCELYLATTNQYFHNLLLNDFTPGSAADAHWTWQHMDEGYGRAIRSYAFAAQTGRVPAAALNASWLALCDGEITNWAATETSYASQSAYGTSFPWESKHMNASGWFFSSGQAFDIATGLLLQNNTNWWAALVSNLAYEAGCNPLNLSYVNGLGGLRYKNIESQYAENDKHQVAPTGLIIGNIISGFVPVAAYPSLEHLSLPWDSSDITGCPMYDRGGDAPNYLTENTGMDEARALAVSAFLMGQGAFASQPWVPANNLITLTNSGNGMQCTLQSSIDYSSAAPLWESFGNPLGTNATYQHQVLDTGDQWIETEFLLPDGRRLFATNSFPATAPAVTNWETVSITTINNPSILNVQSGLIRISRDSAGDSLTVNFSISGAINGKDFAWLTGNNYGQFSGTLTLPPGTNHVDISIGAEQPPDDFSTKNLQLTLIPGNYNISYPGYAVVSIIRTNATATNTVPYSPGTNTVSTNTVACIPGSTIPLYSTPPALTNAPALTIPTNVLAAFITATNIDTWLFNDATNSRTAQALNTNLPALQLTNLITGNGYLLSFNATSIATNVCTLAHNTNWHGIIFKSSIYVTAFDSYSVGNAFILSCYQNWYCYLEFYQDRWATTPMVRGCYQDTVATNTVLSHYVTPNQWHDFAMQLDAWGYVIYVDGSPVADLPSTDFKYWGAKYPVILNLGQINGAFHNFQINTY